MHRVRVLAASIALALCFGCGSSSQSTTTAAATPQPAAATIVPGPSAASVLASPSPATATPLPPPTTPSPTAAPAATATAGTSATEPVWVANTDGGGVFLRSSEHEGDRTDLVLPDNTPLMVEGQEVEGDGQRWYPVKTEDGREGFVQVIYTTRTQPTAPPGQTNGEPK